MEQETVRGALRALSLSWLRRVFVNRALHLSKVEAIGFDMDYTLCRYHPDLEVLATELAIGHLIKRGYPEALRNKRFDPKWGTRGLVIDCEKGNVCKMDAHRHVTRVWHGLRPLGDEARRENYHADPPHLSADRWVPLDTLFSTPEAWLYCQLVEMLESDSGASLDSHESRRLYADIRYCIDLVHRDDSLKAGVRADMERYIDVDLLLPHALHRLRSAGKKLFLLTNSDLGYTEKVMTWLLNGRLAGYARWEDYFESIWVSARKPLFFESREEPFEVSAKIFEGGGRTHFERRLGVSGDQILYVGDHIYGDVLKASSTTGWNTALIVPELEHEVDALASESAALADRAILEEERFELESSLAAETLNLRGIRRAERRAESGAVPDEGEEVDVWQGLSSAELLAEREEARALVADLRGRLEQCTTMIRELSARIERHFNPRWGQLLKERNQHSLFGSQMESYACLYTSRVSNFAACSPTQHFRSPRDLLPHERLPRV